MKKLTIVALSAILLTGCVKQEDYDALCKVNAKLEKQIERLEADNDVLEDENAELRNTLNGIQQAEIPPKDDFTVENIKYVFTNEANNETVTFELVQESVPVMVVEYRIPDYIDDISAYERKVTWFVTTMVDCANSKGFTIYDITASTPDNPERSLSASLYEGETNYWGTDTEGHYRGDPDWFIEACGDLVRNNLEDAWIMQTAIDIYGLVDLHSN